MDPLLNFCLRYDSLTEDQKIDKIEVIPFINKKFTDLRVKIITGKTPIIKYTDNKMFETINHAKDAFDDENYIEARNVCNPFEKLDNSIFINRAAIKLANIDAIFDVGKGNSENSSQRFTLLEPQSEKDFTFCDIAAGPGGFTQYLQYRYPKSQGFGMTLVSVPHLNWNTNKLDMDRFKVTNGKDDTGNLYTNWDDIVNLVLDETENFGVDFVVGDGGIETEGRDREQEYLSTRLFIVQCLVATCVCKTGGDACVKVFSAVNAATAHVIYIMSYIFEKVYIFKPATSRPANAERYVVFKNMSNENQELVCDILKEANVDNVISIVDSVDEDFEKWLKEENIKDIRNQYKAIRDILQNMGDSNLPDIVEKYNINKFAKILALP